MITHTLAHSDVERSATDVIDIVRNHYNKARMQWMKQGQISSYTCGQKDALKSLMYELENKDTFTGAKKKSNKVAAK